MLTLAAVGAALLPPEPYAAVPDNLRPGAWSQETLSAPAALALLAVNWRLRLGCAKGWLIWAGLISGALHLNTPVELAAEWFNQVHVSYGKRHEVFDASGHAPFLTEAERFTDTVRRFAQSLQITVA